MGKTVKYSGTQSFFHPSEGNYNHPKPNKQTRFESTTEHPYGDNYHTSETPEKFRLYPRRWINLCIFSLITMSNSCLWITLSSITDVIGTYYHVKPIFVDWLSLTFFVICGILAVPGVYVLSKLGLRSAMFIAAFLNAVGSSTRILALEPKWFHFVIVGQCITAVGSVFALAVPPKLAAVWFGEHERASATIIATLMNVFGVCVGFLQATIMISDVPDQKSVRFALFRLLTSQSLFCWVLLLLVLMFVHSTPPHPPTASEAFKEDIEASLKLSFLTSVGQLIPNLDYMFISTAYALNFASEVSLSILLNQIFKCGYAKTKAVSDKKIGWLGFIGTFCGIPASFIAGIFLDRYKKYKLAANIFLLASLFASMCFAVSLSQGENFYLTSVAFCAFNVCSCPYFCFGLEHIAEISYPIPEDIASGIPLVLSNLFSFAMTYGFQTILDFGHLNIVLYGYCIILGISCILTMSARSQLKREIIDHTSVEF